MWPALAVAVVVHATILLPLHGLGLFAIGHGASIRSTPRPALAELAVDLAVTCKGDVALGGVGRFALCAAPWAGELEPCLSDAATNLWMDLSSCSLGSDPGVAVAMLEPHAIDMLKAIDPEKLAEEPPPPLELAKPVVLPTPAVPAPAPPPPPPAPPRPTQVVETAKPDHEEDPQNARLLAEYSTKVEKETVARGATKEPMVAKSKPEELAVVTKPKDEPSVDKPPDPDRATGKDASAPDVPGTLAMRNPGAPVPAAEQQDPRSKGAPTGARGPSIVDGFMPRRGDGAIEQDRRARQELPRGTNGGGGGAPPNLKPSKEMLERIAGGGSVDHLDNVDSGDETGLNAMRWVHASFFNRLKRQVAQNWDPATVWHRVDPTGAVNGFKTRITELRVALDVHGAVDKILVIAPSGVGELDDEAVRAFKAASPFPNAPSSLAGNDGLITFAFSFYFEIGATHTSWRVIKGL